MKRMIKGWDRPDSKLVSVEIELPYYWEQSLGNDGTVLYGRLNPDLSEDEIMCRGKGKFEIEMTEPLPEGEPWQGTCYLRGEYKSDAIAFYGAFERLKDAVRKIGNRKWERSSDAKARQERTAEEINRPA